jgi:hypothetical protein
LRKSLKTYMKNIEDNLKVDAVLLPYYKS